MEHQIAGPQPIDKAEDFPEQLPRHHHLGHLEGDIATVDERKLKQILVNLLTKGLQKN